MPWTGEEFREKHNHKLGPAQADKAAKIATAMVGRGVDEGVAIATANKRAGVHKRANKLKSRGLISDKQGDKFGL